MQDARAAPFRFARNAGPCEGRQPGHERITRMGLGEMVGDGRAVLVQFNPVPERHCVRKAARVRAAGRVDDLYRCLETCWRFLAPDDKRHGFAVHDLMKAHAGLDRGARTGTLCVTPMPRLCGVNLPQGFDVCGNADRIFAADAKDPPLGHGIKAKTCADQRGKFPVNAGGHPAVIAPLIADARRKLGARSAQRTTSGDMRCIPLPQYRMIAASTLIGRTPVCAAQRVHVRTHDR